MTDNADGTSKRAPLEAKDDFEIGQTLGGKYKLIAKIGSGGIGTVYQVQQVFLNKEFALKTIDIRTVSNVSVQRFQLEAKIAASLNHPNLVHVYDFGLLDNDQPYLVMDLVKGITFAQYLKENGPLAVNQIAAFFAPACFGLLAAHDQGLVHRDIKPGNIMVITSLPLNSEQRIKVVDFGIAKHTSRDSGEIQALTATGEVFGSPLYMSPEQCIGGIVDHRSDIYSLGCVLFEMLTGTPPFYGQSALSTMMLHESGKPPTLKEASLGLEFPEALEHVVAKMLCKQPAERYQSIGVVAHDLANVGKGNAIVVKSTASPKSKPVQKSKAITMTASKLYGLFTATAIIPATLAWFGGYSFKQNSAPPALAVPPNQNNRNPENPNRKALTVAIAPQPQALPDMKLKAEKRMIENSGQIKASIVVRGKTKQRKYVFPKCGIGVLHPYNQASPSNDFKTIGSAKDVVYTPLDCDLTLNVEGHDAMPALQTPSIFKKIVGQEFRSLYLSNAAVDLGTMIGSVDAPSESEDGDNIADILENVLNWSGLETLTLKSCVLSDKALNALNKLTGIKNLIFNECSDDLQKLVQQPFLNHLHFLMLYQKSLDSEAYEKLIRQLAQSSVIHDLRIVMPGGIRRANAIAELKSCPNLRALGILFKTPKVDDQLIEGICQLKNVRDLFLQDNSLSIAQIKMLSKCPWFVNITLSQKKYSPDLAAQLKRIDPRLVFI
ncbi:hypothetical protein BH10CYA1_BH10CYA1_54890 [soil metagenome]